MFSFSLPLTKVAVRGFDPYLTATARATIAGLLAAPLLVANRVPLPERRHAHSLAITMAGAVFGWPVLIALALQRTTSAHVAVIAAFMPLTTAAIAVLRTHERVSWQFWAAACTGTAALVAFAVSRGGAAGNDAIADLLVVGAVISSSWCYVEGASVTHEMPGWQVISWVVVLALPLTLPATIGIFAATHHRYDPSAGQWSALGLLGASSMYVAFFAWYRGLALAGTARGGQVQQLQALLTLVWSVVLLDEHVGFITVLAALAVTASVVWSQRARAPTSVVPDD